MNRSRNIAAPLFSRCATAKGMSIIELLVVIGIMALLMSLGVIGFQSIGSSRGVTQAATDMASLLEFARSEATARQSYVWVGFRDGTNANVRELQMAAVYSIDGSADGGTNLATLSRTLKVQNASLISFTGVKATTRDLIGNNTPVSDYSTNSRGLTFTVGAISFTNSITFTPRGEAMLNGAPGTYAGFDPVIGIGVAPSREASSGGSANDAGVILDGSTGAARVLRL